MKQAGIVIDLRKCIGCQACVVGCKQVHQLAAGQFWMEVFAIGPYGTFPDVKMHWLPVMCMHCQEAPCIDACARENIRRRSDGIVVLYPEQCHGCRACELFCPYQVVWFDEARQVSTKCNLCADRIDLGQLPYCVQTCTSGALHFGDLGDPTSEVARLFATHETQTLLPDSDTHPLVHYIGP